MNPILHPSIKEEFQREGFVLLKDKVQPAIPVLKAIALKHLQTERGKFNYSLMQNEPHHNLLIHQELKKALNPILETLFTDFAQYSFSFLIKPAGCADIMELHQDWSFTFEEKYNPVTLWIPLQDVNKENGGLFFLPQSHRMLKNFRSYSYPTARININNSLKHYICNVEVCEGDIVLFHPAVFHGSYGNQSSTDRIIAVATILPKNAPYLHVKKVDDETASVEYIEETAFFFDLKYLEKEQAFKGLKSERIAYRHSCPSEADIINYFNEKAGSQADKNSC